MLKRYKQKRPVSNFLNILVIIVVLITLVVGILMVRNKLLQNAQEMGMSLAQSYANEEETHLATISNMLELGAQYVDQLYESGDTQRIQQWLEDYFTKTSKILGENTTNPYAVIDGKIIAANPWEGDDVYDYINSEWYRQAVEAQGEVIFTDVYQDVITGKSVVTLAKQLERQNDVLVMDIYPEKLDFNSQKVREDLPEECSLYLCDSTGNLITAYTPWTLDKDENQKNAAYLYKGIKNGSLNDYDTFFIDYENEKRGAYFQYMSNDWIVILTIPFDSILMGEKNGIVYILIGTGLFLFSVLFIMSLRNLVQARKIKTYETTTRILSDAYYAIYLLDYQKGTYEFIKPPEEIAGELPARGNYQDLLCAIKQYVKPDMSAAFEHAFSLESICRRVQDKITDYGGDYKRRFGEEYKWVNVRTLFNETLAPDQVIFCFRVVELERRQQQQHVEVLREALDSAQDSAREKEIFFNSMSHDMRTPLNAIIGFSELVKKNRDNWDKVSDYMDKILHASRQLLTLINDILELSKINAGKSIIKNREFDLQQCIKESVDLFENAAVEQNKQLTETFQINDTLVFGDSFKLEQIMNNLLSNAIKYTNAGASIHVDVQQIMSVKQNKYQIIVEDTGIGMSEVFLAHIFDPYTRETAFGSKTVTGTGLGMVIVQSLVQQLGGEITVESHLGQGTRFSVTLPFEAVYQKTEQQPEEKAAEETVHLEGCHILLAEDNALNVEMITEILEMNGMHVTAAANGREVVEKFSQSENNTFDAILMDMQMPVMDGYEATKTIRALSRNDAKVIPIIAVTANAFPEDIAKTVYVGMSGHISKPVDFKLLIQTLERLINRGKREDSDDQT